MRKVGMSIICAYGEEEKYETLCMRELSSCQLVFRIVLYKGKLEVVDNFW
jgi:hypothetical protein